MKATDIRRLERALEYMNKAYELIERTEDSIYMQPTEFLNNTEMSANYAIKEIRKGVANQRHWLGIRIECFKELV